MRVTAPRPRLPTTKTRFCRCGLCLPQHRVGHVDPDGAPAGTSRLRGKKKVRSRTAADVDDGGPREDILDPKGIHPLERLDGSRGQGGERFAVVPEEVPCVVGPAVKMELAVRGARDARVDRLNLLAKAGGVEIDRTGDGHVASSGL
jgi:hypothetical protein